MIQPLVYVHPQAKIAEDDASSPIYGMPVLKVWKAKLVVVNKRSMRPGYAGIENELFFCRIRRCFLAMQKQYCSI